MTSQFVFGFGSPFFNAFGSTFRRGYAFARNHPTTLLSRIIQGVCAAHLFNENIGGLRVGMGPSMMPTMSIGPEVLIQDSLSHRLNPGNLARGDLVIAISPQDPTKQVCKRIVGLPGDTVCVDPTGEYAPSTEHVIIPPGHVWLMGDNAPWSRDSRAYGPVSIGLIRGTIVARILPWNTRTVFRNPVTYIDGRVTESASWTGSISYEQAVLSNS